MCLLIEWLKLGTEGLRVHGKGFLYVGDILRVSGLLAQSQIAFAHLSIYCLEDFRKNIAFDFYGSCGESGNLILGVDGTFALRDGFLVGFSPGLSLFCLACHFATEVTHGVHLLLKGSREERTKLHQVGHGGSDTFAVRVGYDTVVSEWLQGGVRFQAREERLLRLFHGFLFLKFGILNLFLLGRSANTSLVGSR